jgi:hypothetical protein
MNPIRERLLNFVLNESADDGWLLVQRRNSYELEAVEWDERDEHYVAKPDKELGFFRKKALDYVLGGSASDGWLMVQRGNKYELEAAEYRSDADAYVVTDEEGEEQFFEDSAGLMHTFRGVPLGIATDEARPIVDGDTAQVATAAGEKMTDGGVLTSDQQLSVNDVRKRLKVGEVNTQYGSVHIVNPFHRKDDEPDIVDLREAVRLFPNKTSPDTPRKAADNAVEAERATGGLDVGQLTDWVQIVGSFLMGAIVTEYIAGSSGGGGGVEIPVTLAFDALVTLL